MSERVWNSEFYLEKYEHLLSYLEPDAARSKAKRHRMISQVQWEKLSDLAGRPYSHNETLLRHLEKQPEAFPCLVEIVRAQGDSKLAGHLERALPSHLQTLPAVTSMSPPSLDTRNLSHDPSGNLHNPAVPAFLQNEAPAAHREHSQSQSQQPIPAGASSGLGSTQSTFELVPARSDETPTVVSSLDQTIGSVVAAPPRQVPVPVPRPRPIRHLSTPPTDAGSALKSQHQSPGSEPRAKRRFSTQLKDTDPVPMSLPSTGMLASKQVVSTDEKQPVHSQLTADAMDGQEACNLAQDDVLDRRFDGYLPTCVHLAQDSILPMKLYCTNEACKKYLYKNKDTSLGSCFLIQQLNEDKECGYLYFATAAHNLYCTSCEKYRWVKPILRWTAGQREADEFLLGAGNRGVSESSFYGWMKVSDGYIRGISERRNSKECYPFDYGILAVKIAGIPQATQYAWMVRGMGMFAAPPNRLDFVELAYLCGYPGEVCNKNGIVPPQGPPANPDDLQYLDPKPVGDGYYKWQVKGGRFWMPPDQSPPGQKATGTETPSERSWKERRTAALYPLPQMHDIMICGKQDTDFNKARLYRHYIDSSAGQSGSPVYLFKEKDDCGNQQCVAAGIHVGLWEDVKDVVKRMGFNVAVRLHGDVLTELKRWVSDPSNKATDSLNTGVDVLENTEDFEIVCQPPTFLGSNMAVPVAVAQASQDDASAVKGPSPASTADASIKTASQQDAGMPPSSSADRQDQTRQRNPWTSSEYQQWYHKLVQILNPSRVKNLCFSLQLLDMYDMQEIDAKLTKHDRNSAILAVLSSSPETFGRFREVLHHLNSVGLELIVKDLDKLGPDREKDQDCLKARRTL